MDLRPLQPAAPAATPFDWVVQSAADSPDGPALVFADGIVSYGQLVDEVGRRVASIDAEPGRIVAVRVRHDLASVVDMLAHHAVGAVPAPYTGSPHPEGMSGGDAVLAIATSGSSGASRLVPLTMTNLTASVTASRERLATHAGDRWLACLPLDHIGGLSVLYRSFEAGGAAVVARFDGAIPELVDRAEPTVASLVPTLVHRLLDSDLDALARIRTVLVGGARLPWKLVERSQAAGVHLTPTYGSTETASQVATIAPGDHVRHPGDVGHPLNGFTVRVSEPDATGAGRLTVDGPAVFAGYLGDAPRTGAFLTNDVGMCDADGRLTIIGRSDDVVITGGMNVSTSKVEDAIARIDGVVSVVVVGVTDEEWGTAIAALVDSERSAEVLRAEAAEVLEPHEVPQRLEIGEVPLLSNGKPDRIVISTMFT